MDTISRADTMNEQSTQSVRAGGSKAGTSIWVAAQSQEKLKMSENTSETSLMKGRLWLTPQFLTYNGRLQQQENF